jgi:hypothetical protein
MAFACLCGAPSLIVLSKCSNAQKKGGGYLNAESGMILVFCFRASRAVIWKDRRDPSGNMAFACCVAQPS